LDLIKQGFSLLLGYFSEIFPIFLIQTSFTLRKKSWKLDRKIGKRP
jgi:hypothetical protein